MSEEEKKERVKLIADTIEMLLQQVDMFTNMMTAEDIEILEESRSTLEKKIAHNQSAMALILALGGDYDSAEDEMKVETLNCLIGLIKARNKYKEEALEKQKQLIQRREALRMMGL